MRFSSSRCDEDNPVIQSSGQQGGRAVVLRQSLAGEVLSLLADGEETQILPAAEIPATMEGASGSTSLTL